MTTAPVMSITDEQLAELERKAQAATPGPWSTWGDAFIAPVRKNDDGSGSVECARTVAEVYGSGTSADWKFIAAANPATVLAMIATIRQQRSLLVEISEAPNEKAIYACLDKIDVALGRKGDAAEWPLAPPDAPIRIADDDEVAVPRGLLGAASYAIANKADAPRTVEKLREYAKRAGIAAAPAPAAPQSRVIRAAYEVLLGCVSTPQIAAMIDVPTVERVAKQLNALLPGQDAPAPVAQEPEIFGLVYSIDGQVVIHTVGDPHVTDGMAVYTTPPAAAEQPECGCCGKTGQCDSDCDCAEQPDTVKVPRDLADLIAYALLAGGE
ncbi:ead/Ea22-like family protein [Pseudomonas sp. MAP12]|uniref:Ead/Ea22-like family protein n=1 Tax=Geopseudomonas aromaticivorans TaxID=2849492 RepID=A0ABS6MT67_9GAMM|nr:ead/Ea22-like family protein [Pseudomonas aromaticivorans]MBV2131997.1 ead/Ea22-like family protein [Pseudomonas aromaticivorans]